MIKIYVIPLKNGLWRIVKMTDSRHQKWMKVYQQWFQRKGYRLSISPEMWMQ